MRNRIIAGAAAAAATALVLAGCTGGGTDTGDATDGGDGELTPVTLQLQWLAQAQFGGYYLAQANGYWEDLGLDVEIIPGAVDIVPQDVLAAGDVDFAIAWVPKALASIEAGREHHEHRADLRAQRHPAGLLGRQRHRRARGPVEQAGRQLGIRQRVGALRGPHEADASGSHHRAAELRHERACSTARSTPRRP